MYPVEPVESLQSLFICYLVFYGDREGSFAKLRTSSNRLACHPPTLKLRRASEKLATTNEVWWRGLYDVRTEVSETFEKLESAL